MIELPRAWWSVGDDDLWGGSGTYHRVERALPPVGTLDGSFRWLTPPHPRIRDLTEVRSKDSLHTDLAARAAEAKERGLAFPEQLVTFFADEQLASRIPTATACFFELGGRLVEIPEHDGPERLLRFFNDQQICVIWYVLLAPGATSFPIVAAAPEWLDEEVQEAAETLDDAIEPADLEACASSVEEFLKRFWLENTLWFAKNHNASPIADELATYRDAVRRARGDG